MCNPSDEVAKEIVSLTKIPYAIGVSGDLPNRKAIEFAGGFYGAIADGVAIPKAFDMGLTQMNIEDFTDPTIGVPRLFVR